MKPLASMIGALCAVIFIISLANHSTANHRLLPNPILVLSHTEYLEVQGKPMTRYYFDVFNKEAYPDDMFAASPNLPPCGTNTKASRTWVDFYDQRGKRLNGFCALGKASDLDGIWFSLEGDALPPSWIYIELNDRQTQTKYKSNLAETTQ